MGLVMLDQFLRGAWLRLRDDASPAKVAFVLGAIALAEHTCMIYPEGAELWRRRIQTCPGHDDEGGRSWCAFCGEMAKGEEGGNAK